jgi:hypothetical protein
VMDEKGQIDTDTVNFLISDENDEENENWINKLWTYH